jgi:hypothetical protein
MQRLECRSEQNVLEIVFKERLASVWVKFVHAGSTCIRIHLKPHSIGSSKSVSNLLLYLNPLCPNQPKSGRWTVVYVNST